MLLAQEFPDRCIHAVGDAAYHGTALLVERSTVTTRLPANAALYAPAPPRTGNRGRPRLKGHRLRHPGRDRRGRDLAAGGRATAAATPLRSLSSIRSGTARSPTPKAAPSSVREPGREKVLAIFTTDTTSDTETVVTRYADRWPIQVAIAGGKQLLGIGQARKRLQRAVERTVPLSFCVYSLVAIWYTLHGYHPDDLTGRRVDQPWYSHKDDIAFEDMLAKLRRSLVAARITGVDAAQPDPRKYRDYELACAAAAA